MLIAHLRARMQFYFFLIAAVNTFIYLHVGQIPWWVLMLITILQLCVLAKSVQLSIQSGNGFAILAFIVMHVTVFAAYFERLLFAIK